MICLTYFWLVWLGCCWLCFFVGFALGLAASLGLWFGCRWTLLLVLVTYWFGFLTPIGFVWCSVYLFCGHLPWLACYLVVSLLILFVLLSTCLDGFDVVVVDLRYLLMLVYFVCYLLAGIS